MTKHEDLISPNLESNMQPLISVIMATYDEPTYFLKNSIDSILQQSHENIELIICLDNPANTASKIFLLAEQALDTRLIIIFNESNLGLGFSLNRCLDAAQGEYVARMDADDFSFPQRLQRQLETLNVLTHNTLLFTEVVMCDHLGNIVPRTFPINATFKKNFFLDDAFVHASYIARLELVRKYKYCISHSPEDYEMYIRMIAGGCEFALLNEKLYQYNFNSKIAWRSNHSRATRTNRTAKIMLPLLLKNRNQLRHCRGYYRSLIKYSIMLSLSSSPFIYGISSRAFALIRNK